MAIDNNQRATTPVIHRKAMPRWAERCYNATNYLMYDAGGGPRTLQLDHAINVQKFVTAFAILGMMYWYDNFSTAAWIYLGLHGVYGYTWLIKDLAFPNKAFEARVTIGSLFVIYGGLNIAYWSLAWLFISRHIDPADGTIFAAIAIHTLGVALMAGADVQKNCTLRYRPGLIDNGLFAYTRNPNYLGESMIYGSYALLAAHWFGWLVVAVQFFVLFLPRMLHKDASISRHQGWEAYEAQSGLFLPWAIINGRALFGRKQSAVSESAA